MQKYEFSNVLLRDEIWRFFFPILGLPYNIGICTNIVQIPTFNNLFLPYPHDSFHEGQAVFLHGLPFQHFVSWASAQEVCQVLAHNTSVKRSSRWYYFDHWYVNNFILLYQTTQGEMLSFHSGSIENVTPKGRIFQIMADKGHLKKTSYMTWGVTLGLQAGRAGSCLKERPKIP